MIFGAILDFWCNPRFLVQSSIFGAILDFWCNPCQILEKVEEQRIFIKRYTI